MHEQSLVRALLKQVEELRSQHDGQRVSEVRVEVGTLSGIEPLLLASAFEQLATESKAFRAKLVIDEVALLAECESCVREFEVIDFVFRCPTCGRNVRIIRGDEIQLVSVSIQSTEPTRERVP